MSDKCKNKVDPRPCSAPCEKCGGTDTYLKHRRKGEVWDRPAGDWGRLESDPPPQGTDLVVYSDYKCEAMKECLTHFCQTCTYEWTTDIHKPNAEVVSEQEVNLKNSTCVSPEQRLVDTLTHQRDGFETLWKNQIELTQFAEKQMEEYAEMAGNKAGERDGFETLCQKQIERAELAEHDRDMLVIALEDTAGRLHTANVPEAFKSGYDLSEYLIDGYEKAHKALSDSKLRKTPSSEAVTDERKLKAEVGCTEFAECRVGILQTIASLQAEELAQMTAERDADCEAKKHNFDMAVSLNGELSAMTAERDTLQHQVDQLSRDSAIQDLENKRKEEVITKLQYQVQILIKRFDSIFNHSPCEKCPAKVLGCTLKCAVTMSDWSIKEANKMLSGSTNDKTESV